MQDDWSSPSGSRWEPVPQHVPVAQPDAAPASAAGGTPSVPAERSRRGRAVAVLLTLLGAGAVATGVAYEHGSSATPTDQPVAQSSQVAGTDDHPDRGSPDGDRSHGHRGGPRTSDGQPVDPSGAPS